MGLVETRRQYLALHRASPAIYQARAQIHILPRSCLMATQAVCRLGWDWRSPAVGLDKDLAERRVEANTIDETLTHFPIRGLPASCCRVFCFAGPSEDHPGTTGLSFMFVALSTITDIFVFRRLQPYYVLASVAVPDRIRGEVICKSVRYCLRIKRQTANLVMIFREEGGGGGWSQDAY